MDSMRECSPLQAVVASADTQLAAVGAESAAAAIELMMSHLRHEHRPNAALQVRALPPARHTCIGSAQF